MKSLKIQLHVHTADDPTDRCEHTALEMLDFAASKNYDVVAITHHDNFHFTEELRVYAERLGILLIPGIEKTIEHRHVLIINATAETEKIQTFFELAKYKKYHPDCLIIAPHPYYPRGFCLLDKLTENINLFDAIEYSWFYMEKFNSFNKKAERIAKLHRKPLLATSDNHILPYFDLGYTLVFSEKSWPEIRKNILEGKFEMRSEPLTLATYLKSTTQMITQFDIPHQFRSLKGIFTETFAKPAGKKS